MQPWSFTCVASSMEFMSALKLGIDNARDRHGGRGMRRWASSRLCRRRKDSKNKRIWLHTMRKITVSYSRMAGRSLMV
eukprot:IDg2006t1